MCLTGTRPSGAETLGAAARQTPELRGQNQRWRPGPAAAVIRLVSLAAERSFFPDGLKVWLSGWGRSLSDAYFPSPETLQEVELPIMSNIECSATYGCVTPNMICAGPDL
ncbi:mastin-like [Xiphophorus maculatus]|uniref:mastin-like n=1 Tax=Xiphophorus maculatus TaxID=8083 RepID=UPI0003B4F5D9|nr:mastin-like [Xiphophorus maculatus]